NRVVAGQASRLPLECLAPLLTVSGSWSHSGFGFLSSFVIRHSTTCANQVHGPNACGKNERASFAFAFDPHLWQLCSSSQLKKVMRAVYVIAGGITKFAKANPANDFRLMVKESFDGALADSGGKLTPADINGSVISYFSDHFTF